MERRKRRSFNAEFKAEAIRLVREGGKSVSQVAKDLDLTDSALRNWMKQAEVDAGKGPAGALTTAEREEFARLRKENRQLTMERDFLKNSSRSVPHRLLRKKLGGVSATARSVASGSKKWDACGHVVEGYFPSPFLGLRSVYRRDRGHVEGEGWSAGAEEDR